MRSKTTASKGDDRSLIAAFFEHGAVARAPVSSELKTLSRHAKDPGGPRLLTGPMEMLELVYSAVLVRDIFGVITFWNREAERLYGWSEREALGQVSHDLLRTKFAEPIGAVQN
ncbi:MAG: PAS domain-containing protein, partial [Terriglobia bacterium]